ncbi:MAG: maleylacetoacetate isomerase [Rhodospirillum sp.]|nr:maleylacetoacetate isomerase [Rhodospirillum sp.]MCF8491254.1 maleylacetoacetate isomerase [Rhodospirillum sp.]MCF8500770.1 maleylacetoacetate isomerase [Rhodospirillum sp.]
MKLYTYWRSSAAYRVRIALNLKGLEVEMASVHLAKGDQERQAYGAINPQKLIPCLELDDGMVIAQSLAIIEYLDETHPNPALLPADPVARARTRALAQAIAVDIHPVNNLRVLKYLKGVLGLSESAKDTWYTHWILEGFAGVEESLTRSAIPGPFLGGAAPGLFEICLIPQLYNARRFSVDLSPFPRLTAIEELCVALPAFKRAAPENQPDAQ